MVTVSKDASILAGLVKNMKRRGSDPLRPLIDAYMLERQSAMARHEALPFSWVPPVRPGGRFSPSDLCGCERQAAFKFLEMPGRRRVDPDQELIFDDGNWRHLKWESTFRDMELVLGSDRCHVVAVERRVKISDLYVSGSLDAILKLRPAPTAKRLSWVIDIKGINDAGFQRILRDDAPIPKHVKQIVAYCRAVGVPRGILWYEDKNNQHTRAYIVRYHDDAWVEVEGWCQSVLSFLERETLPPMHPECNRGTITYERCPYSSHCFGKRTVEEVTNRAYEGFTSIEGSWQAGHRAVRGAD